MAADVQPAWRSLYRLPFTKRVADLQWRELQGIVAVNAFLAVIRLDSTLLSLCRVQVQSQRHAVCVQPEVQKEEKSALLNTQYRQDKKEVAWLH